MTDFLDRLDSELRDAAERRGQPRRRRPSAALKAAAVLAALALLAVGTTRLLNRESSDRVAAEQTPNATPTRLWRTWRKVRRRHRRRSGAPGLLAAPLGSAVLLFNPPDGRPSTADPSLGTVVLYRSGGEEDAEYAGYLAKIDRVGP